MVEQKTWYCRMRDLSEGVALLGAWAIVIQLVSWWFGETQSIANVLGKYLPEWYVPGCVFLGSLLLATSAAYFDAKVERDADARAPYTIDDSVLATLKERGIAQAARNKLAEIAGDYATAEKLHMAAIKTLGIRGWVRHQRVLEEVAKRKPA